MTTTENFKTLSGNVTCSNGFTNFFSCRRKYRNIKLVSASDDGYRAYKYKIIKKRRANRGVDYVTGETSALYKVSGDVEYIVRKWYGSHSNRIIKYDVIYQGVYQTHYKECDILRLEDDGSITIGEIKASNKPSAFKALSQLQLSYEILSAIYQDINPVAITVDMASSQNSKNIFESHNEKVISNLGFQFTCISLSLGNVIDYVHKNNIDKDLSLFNQAHIEALNCVRHRTEKSKIKQMQKAQQILIQKESMSVFGLLLQNALRQRNIA
jgi:hypothetical protein